MRIVAVTRILDEADIVEAFVRHTAAQVDHHILLDNGSRDATRDILLCMRREGIPLTLLNNPAVSFSEIDANSFLFTTARDLGAHWVVFLDADEFIDARRLPGGLRGLLGHAQEYCPLISQIMVALTDYIPIHADDAADPIVPRRIKWRDARTDNFKAIVNTRILSAGARIHAGGHGAYWPAGGSEVWPFVIEPDLTYAHYSERSTWQWMSKFVRGWAKVLAAGSDEVARGTSAHYGPAFEMLRDRPGTILDDPRLMGFKNEKPGLSHDPITYLGGELRYTPPIDHRMRAVTSVLGYLEDLASRHGRLLETCPEARHLTAQWDAIRPVYQEGSI